MSSIVSTSDSQLVSRHVGGRKYTQERGKYTQRCTKHKCTVHGNEHIWKHSDKYMQQTKHMISGTIKHACIGTVAHSKEYKYIKKTRYPTPLQNCTYTSIYRFYIYPLDLCIQDEYRYVEERLIPTQQTMLSCFGTLAFGQNKNWWELNSHIMCAGRNRRREKAQEQCSRPCEAMNQMCRSEIWIWKLDSTGQAGRISLVADLSVVNVLCMYIAYSNIRCFLILNKIDIVLYCWLDADGVWDNREWPASFPFNDPSSDIHSALLTPLSEWPVNFWT